MDQYLAELVVNELVRAEEAYEKSADKDSFYGLVEKRRVARE